MVSYQEKASKSLVGSFMYEIKWILNVLHKIFLMLYYIIVNSGQIMILSAHLYMIFLTYESYWLNLMT